jgi:hypothetical protein
MRRKADPASKSLPKKNASFIPPMECLPVPKLPEGPLWVYEVKLDGYRAIGVNPKQGNPTLLSRQDKSLDRKFPDVTQALATLPRGTIIDAKWSRSMMPGVLILIRSLIQEGRLRVFVFTYSICCTRTIRKLGIFPFSNDAIS